MTVDAKKLMRNDGHLSDEGVAFYAELIVKSNTDLIPKSILDHVEVCSECKSRIISIYDVLMIDTNNKASHSITNKFMPILLRIAAVLVLAFGVFYFIIYYLSRHEAQMVTSVNSDHEIDTTVIIKETGNTRFQQNVFDSTNHQYNTVETKKEILLAENFKPDASFEELINTTFRNSTEMKIVRPLVSDKLNFGQKIKFEWTSSVEGPFFIEIYTNRGTELFKSESISESSYLLNKKLSAGLYYWKLENQDNLLFVGEFLVQ